MKKFIFSVVAVALMGVFTSCEECPITNGDVNDSTVIDTTLVDSTVVDSATVESNVVLK